jgi:hypothetical protein
VTSFEAIRHDILIHAPVDEVWHWLRDPARIREWHGWEDPGLDAEIQQLYIDMATPDDAAHELILGGHRLRLVDHDDDGTSIQVTRCTPAVESTFDWTAGYDDIDEGWGTFLHQLQFAMERHPSDARRTGFWWGRTREPYGPRPVVALGLDALDELQPGDPYELTAAWGDELTGELWFRTAHQVGISVEGWGDGLLVLAESPTLFPPHAASMAIATTYGLADADRAGLLERMTAAWDAHFTIDEPPPLPPDED